MTAPLRVCLDPGHGESTPGKGYAFDDGPVVREWALTRDFCRRLERLAPPGVAVLYTVRPDDPTDLPLPDRASRANVLRPDLILSNHTNAAGMRASGPGEKGSGFEAITSPGKTRADSLATCILDAVAAAGWKVRTDPSDGDPDKEANLAMLRLTLAPAVLLELAFHDNLADVERLERDGDALARAVWAGVLRWAGR